MRGGWVENKKEQITATDTHICELPYIIAFFNLAFFHIACQKPLHYKICSKLKIASLSVIHLPYK